MDDLCQATNLSSLPVESRSILLKTFIREASLHARDCMFEDLPNGHTSSLLRLSSIARAVWQKDIKLYNILIIKSELARSHLVLVGHEPRILDPNVFEEQFREAKMIASEGSSAEIKAEHTNGNRATEFNGARKTARLNRHHVLEKLWHPKAPSLWLMGVKLGDDEAAELNIDGGEGTFVFGDGFINSANPADFMKAFAHLWGRVFGPNNIDVEVARRLIQEYLEYVKWDWALLQPPTPAMVQFVISKLKTTARGLDGIPNMAWTFGGEYLARYILDLIDAFCSDQDLPADINWSIMGFIDKSGEAPEHAQAPGMISRHPLDTRPLSLKQADNKLVAGVLYFFISPAIANGAIDIQTGFIHGRILTRNAVESYFYGRMQAFDFFSERKKMEMIHISSKGMVNSLPFLLLWDFASAFPSVAHAWLFCVLDAIKLWKGFVTGIRSLYIGNEAFGQSGGVMSFLFIIVSGVLQGCPLSGTLFVLVIDHCCGLSRENCPAL